MMTQGELAEQLLAVNQQLTKIGTETTALLTKVQELTDALAAAGNVTPEVEAALAALKTQAEVVDEMVPDPVVPETPVTPEPPVTGEGSEPASPQ